MIIKGGTKDMIARYKPTENGKWWVVEEVYRGARLVWQAIRSCYGSGAWLGERPWLADDPWKGN